MAQIIKWCKNCNNVISIEHAPEITEVKNDYTNICKTCQKKGFVKKHEKDSAYPPRI